MSHFTPNLPTVDKPTTARNRTFTLIEMLVVVVIIGILAGVLVPRLMGAKERASDSARIVKVGQISSAVELYAQEQGSKYPLAVLTGTPGISIATPSVSTAISSYLTTIPTDPGKGTVAISTAPGNIQVTGDSFAYWTNTGGTVYAITALMESKKGNTTNGTGLIDSDKQGGYQKVGKGLTTNIVVAGGGAEPAEAGIYHIGNTIVVKSGAVKYVIADKNAGATVAGTDHTNPAIRGSYFQRGNNNGFANVGTITPNRTTPVNTDGLNTYTDSTWIYAPSWNLPRGDWSLNQNDALRSAGTAQGPCGIGYHIPTYDEWVGLVNLRASLKGETITSSDPEYIEFSVLDAFGSDLLLPKAGSRGYNSAVSVYSQGDGGYYWSSTPIDAYAYGLYFYSFGVSAFSNDYRAQGFSVRCFENSY